MREKFLLALLTVCLAGCASSQRITLTPGPDQQALVRDGNPALVSQKSHLVMLRANNRLLKSGSRPVFTLVVRNQGHKPETLYESGITASQQAAGKPAAIRVFRYDELVKEEETRQAWAAFGTALAAAGRSMSAANAGYVNTTGTYDSYGYGGATYGTYQATTYDPVRAQLAQQAADAQTTQELAALRAQGEENLGRLQLTILKDNTVMPGEWYGGSIVLAPPVQSNDRSAFYTIVVNFGGEQHTFAVDQIED
jgi:hypothetical protein